MGTSVLIVQLCVPVKTLFAVPPILWRNAGRIKDVCGLRCKESNANDFGLVGRMGALKLAESSIIVTTQVLDIYIAQTRQQSGHTNKVPSK